MVVAAGQVDHPEALRHDPFLHPDTRVRGFVLDIESFDLEEIFVD